MSDMNADDNFASGAAKPQPSYRPSYRAEPRQKVPHYPGVHYQVYPAMFDTGIKWQPPARHPWRKRAVRPGLWLIGLVTAFVLGFRMLDLDLDLDLDMTGDYRVQRAPVSQATFVATLGDNSNLLNDASSTSSFSALNQTTISAPLARLPLNVPAEPTAPAVRPVKTAADISDEPAELVGLPIKITANILDRAAAVMALPVNPGSNIPDSPIAPATQSVASAGAGHTIVGESKAAKAVSAYSERAAESASTTCSEALRAMQLCSMRSY